MRLKRLSVDLMRIPHEQPPKAWRMVAEMQRYALDAGLQATVTPLAPVGPLLHVSNRAADDTRPGLPIPAIPDTVTLSARCNKTLPHRGRPPVRAWRL